MVFTAFSSRVYNVIQGSLLLAALVCPAFNVSVLPLATQLSILAGIWLDFALGVTLVAGLDRLQREKT